MQKTLVVALLGAIANTVEAQVEQFGPTDIVRAQLERSWIHPGYLRGAKLYAGGPDSLLFEANIAPPFTLTRLENRFLRPLFAPFRAIVFTPKVELRMFITDSKPVRTPSYRPNLLFFVKPPTRDSSESIVLRSSHYSNGQEDPAIVAGALNEQTGNFATNFWQLGYSKAFVDSAWMFIVNPTFVEKHFGQDRDEEVLYGQYRSRLTLMAFLPAPQSHQSAWYRKSLLQADLAWAWDSPLRKGAKRLDASITWTFHAPEARAGELGYFATLGYWGADYYNIQYRKGSSITLFRAGLVAHSVRYRLPSTR